MSVVAKFSNLAFFLRHRIQIHSDQGDSSDLSALLLSTHRTEQVQNQHDEQDRPDCSQAAAWPPSRIPVIAASQAEQEQQNNN